MGDSVGCKVGVLVLLVAIIVGALGFVTGFVTHTVLVAASPEEVFTLDGNLSAGETDSESSNEVSGQDSASQASSTDASPSGEQQEAFDLFWEAWGLIERDYYGELPTSEELGFGAIRGAVNTLGDPFTAFIEPDIAEINRQDDTGSFEGIGAYVSMRDGRLAIVNTFEGQPADEAGLQRGDIVLQVDETEIENMSVYEAITLIRGPAGTPVRLTILREGLEPFEVEVTRARIDIPVVEWELREDGIAYVGLFEFSSDASDRLGDAIEEMLDQDPKGLILDLRGNPGGWLNEAVRTAGLFLPRDEVVLIERFKDGTERTYEVPNRSVAPDIPMVVLVDGGSASASEIVAGALQDHDRAVLIGEKTFGKGSVQLPHELSNGAELRVTIARWFTPGDRAIHGEGLEPDIEVLWTSEDTGDEDAEADQDPQLERAVEYLLSGE
jgi:carboxyl-terminal processing protease